MSCGTKRKIMESACDLLAADRLLRNIRIDLAMALQEEADDFREHRFELSREGRESALERMDALAESIDDLRRIDLADIALFLKMFIE